MGAEMSNSACQQPGSLREICRIFNMYDLYRRSSSAFRCIVGSLTPTIDANFRNNCPGSSEISVWILSVTAGILAVCSFEWLFLADILEPSLDCSKAIYFVTICHKRLISGIQRIELFPFWASSAKAFDNCGSSIISPHLISTSWPFWEYDYLLEALGFLGQQALGFLWRRHNRAENLNWNLSGFWWRTFVLSTTMKKILEIPNIYFSY